MSGPRVVALIVLLVTTATDRGWAQASIDVGQRPPSEAGLAPGTAVVQGVVTTDSGAPMPAAEVRLVGDALHRLTMSDTAGRFVFRDLSEEVMRIHASKAGFVDAQYGPFALAPGQRETASLALGRGGVIHGQVFDEYGEPAAGALVEALLAVSVEGLQRRLQRVGSGDLADDTGAFRLYGLSPGTYFVSAGQGPADTARRGAATYYPGTPSVANALPLEVETGSQVLVSLSLGTVPLARVSGVLVDAAGTPIPGFVNLLPDVRTTPGGLEDPVSVALDAARLSGAAGPDGRFTIADVPPGSYELTGATPRIPRETASLPVFVSGEDVSGLTLVTRPRSR